MTIDELRATLAVLREFGVASAKIGDVSILFRDAPTGDMPTGPMMSTDEIAFRDAERDLAMQYAASGAQPSREEIQDLMSQRRRAKFDPAAESPMDP